MDSTPTTVPYLRIRNLSKKFGAFTALDTIDLDIMPGEFVSFLGPSGCGKTTLLRAISGLDVQTAGSIHQGGRDISTLPVAKRDFGIVFQSYALFPNLTIKDNVAYGLVSAEVLPVLGRRTTFGVGLELYAVRGATDLTRVTYVNSQVVSSEELPREWSWSHAVVVTARVSISVGSPR